VPAAAAAGVDEIVDAGAVLVQLHRSWSAAVGQQNALELCAGGSPTGCACPPGPGPAVGCGGAFRSSAGG
jgi:hypothetical protein